MIAALDVLVDGSLNGVTLAKLRRLELPLQLCNNPQIAYFGSTLFFFHGYCPNTRPRGCRPHLCVLLIRCSSILKWAWAV